MYFCLNYRGKHFLFPYDCEKAQRKLLQMPVTSLRMNSGCAVVEKRVDGLYDDIKCEISKMPVWSKAIGAADRQSVISLDAFTSILSAAPNCGEKERMKHLMLSTHNMLARQGTKFGMWNMRHRAERITSATERINQIKSKHKYFAKMEKKVLLQSVGRALESYLSSDSSGSEDSDYEQDVLYDKSSESRQPGQPNQPEQPPEQPQQPEQPNQPE